MKNQIILAIVAVFLVTACSSLENRPTLGTGDSAKKGLQYSFNEGAAGRDFARQ